MSVGLKDSALQRASALGFRKGNRVFWLESPAEVNCCRNPWGQASWALGVRRPSAGPAPGLLKAWVSTWPYWRAEAGKLSCRAPGSRDW